MVKSMLGTLALLCATQAIAAPAEDVAKDKAVTPASQQMCGTNPDSQCVGPQGDFWRPEGDFLRLKLPFADMERGDGLDMYLSIALMAHQQGDLNLSLHFYKLALEQAKDFRPQGGVADDSKLAAMIISFEIARLDLSLHDFAGALHKLDDFKADDPQGHWSSEDAELMRCAALIGLQRDAEADSILQGMVPTLNLDGVAPWEGSPLGSFGPQVVNPYDIARRIAGRFMREKKYDEAIALLQKADAQWQETMANKSKQLVKGGYWAEHTNRAYLLEDEAAVYLAMAADDKAEPLLRTALALRETKPGQNAERLMQRDLQRLAEIEERKGQHAEAVALAARAAAIGLPQPLTDPLAVTLAYASQ